MELMNKQKYICYADYLGNKILEWVDAKPKNRDLRNVLKATSIVLQHNIDLEVENEILRKKVSLYRDLKNKQEQEFYEFKQTKL